MTSLEKLIRRRSCRVNQYGRRYIVMLEPGDTLAMREERRRTVYRAAFSKVFAFLARCYAEEQRRLAAEKRRKAKP